MEGACRETEISFLKPGRLGYAIIVLLLNVVYFQVKVISRSARGLAMEYVGAGGGTSRSILEQAQDYVNVS